MLNSLIPPINVIGAGLAGSECALQLAQAGLKVRLHEMRDRVMTPAHRTSKFGEIVCSNSFGSTSEISAPGQLKWEARRFDSFILRAAEKCQVPAGQALGIDRERFSELITSWICQHPLIEIRNELVESIDDVPRPCVVATGPLTDERLAKSISGHFGGEFLYFFDAIAPIIDTDSIDTSIAWKADRYDKGTPDYYNCPLNKEEYLRLIESIKMAPKVEPKHFEITPFFESCMPIETMVARGDQTLRFGPMKPVGLTDPRTGRYPYAVVQLRQDNKEGTAYNIVGFQTRMTYGAQKEVFRLIPGLQNAEFLKLGSIHRNLFINTPKVLTKNLESKNDSDLYFAGQITGVEGYFESTCTGIFVARTLLAKLRQSQPFQVPRATAFGSLINAITDETKIERFQPTNINMGLFPPLAEKIRDKTLRKSTQIQLAQSAFLMWINQDAHPIHDDGDFAPEDLPTS